MCMSVGSYLYNIASAQFISFVQSNLFLSLLLHSMLLYFDDSLLLYNTQEFVKHCNTRATIHWTHMHSLMGPHNSVSLYY